MGTVFVNEDAVLVQAIIGVAADVVPALQHQHPLATPLREFPCGHAAGIAGTNDQTVKVLLHQVTAFSC